MFWFFVFLLSGSFSSSFRHLLRFLVLNAGTSTSMSLTITSRSRSENGRCTHLIRGLLYRSFCVNMFLEGLTPRRRTRLIEVGLTIRCLRSLLNCITTTTVINSIILVIPLINVIRRNLNYDRLSSTRTSIISITLRLRSPKSGLLITQGRDRAPS